MKKKIILIGGPTGVGKTKLGITCANLFNGEIISCDSVAIYKNLDIGSAKPTKLEQQQAIHHQIDIVNANEEYSVADYVKSTKKIIDEIWNKGRLPIIVGGTGLFMKALLFPLSLGNAEKNQEVRDEYKELALKYSNAYVYNILKEKDPISASKIHENDIKRVIRALEILQTTGKLKQNEQKLESEYDYYLVFLNGDRSEIYSRINLRVDNMLKTGLQTEIEYLINDLNLNKDNQSMQAIGYKEWFDYFDKKISYEELVEKIKINSRHYAKRQITWFKAMPNVHEYDYKNVELILSDIKKFLQ